MEDLRMIGVENAEEVRGIGRSGEILLLRR